MRREGELTLIEGGVASYMHVTVMRCEDINWLELALANVVLNILVS